MQISRHQDQLSRSDHLHRRYSYKPQEGQSRSELRDPNLRQGRPSIYKVCKFLLPFDQSILWHCTSHD